MKSLPDRYKHTAIIAATAGLPRALRVRARLWALSRLHRAKTRRADVLVVVHPKCGGTWFRVLVHRLYQQKYGFESRRVFKTDELHRLDPCLPSFLVSNGHYTYEGVLEQAFAAPDRGLDPRGKKLIFLARHPCDIVVSWHIQFRRRTTAYKRELIRNWLGQPLAADAPLWEFAMHPQMGVPGLVDYLNTWARNLEQAEASLLVRYEDLRVTPLETLGRVASFLGLPCDDSSVEEAVRFGSFDNLRALEESNYFENDGLRLRDAKDPDLFKVRQGKVGAYRERFTPEQVEQLEKLVSVRLSPIFGYGLPGGEPVRLGGQGS